MRIPLALLLTALTFLMTGTAPAGAAESTGSGDGKPVRAKIAPHAKPATQVAKGQRVVPAHRAVRGKTSAVRSGRRGPSNASRQTRASVHRAAYAHPGFGETDAATSRAEAFGFCGQMLMPAVELSRISRGMRRDHVGIDLMAARGTPIRAAAAGSILYAGWYYGYGNMVDIRHADGVVTRYAHMSAIGDGMEPGALVLAGDEIGKVGATGHATGPHVHFEVRVAGRPVDPKPYLALASCNGDERGPILEAYAGDRPASARRKQVRSRRASR